LIWKTAISDRLNQAAQWIGNLRASVDLAGGQMRDNTNVVSEASANAYHRRSKPNDNSENPYAGAVKDYYSALRIDPNHLPALNDLAWLLATCPKTEFRDGVEAIEHARKACDLTGWNDHLYLNTLAAAHAEAGDYEAAAKRQKHAILLLPDDELPLLQRNYEYRLKQYESGKTGEPYHQGIVAWWRFDRTAGRVVPNACGNGLDGRLVGNAHIVTDRERGDVLSLDGNGDWVDCGYPPQLHPLGTVTISAWIKIAAFDKPWQAIVTKGDRAWRLHRDNKKNGIEFACTGVNVIGQQWGNIQGTIGVNDDQWHHVAGVYDAKELLLYVDSILDVARNGSGYINTDSFPVWIGANAQRPGREWNGLIDDVRIYDFALTEQEVRDLYESTKSSRAD
jgi:hypothetical protein